MELITEKLNESESVDVAKKLDAEINPELEMEDAASKDEKTDATDIASESARAARRASRRRQAEANVAREQRIAQEQVDLTAESSLRSAIREGTQFYGVAAGVETVEGEDGQQEIALVALLKLNFKVVIPFKELFTYNPIDMSG